MNWVFDSPLTILIGGAVLVAALGVAWLKTGRGALLGAAIGTLVMTALLLVVEQMAVTDREQIRSLIEQAVSDVERNDLPAVLKHVHSKAQTLRDGAEAGMRQYRFERVIARKPLIIVNRDVTPATAHVEFYVNIVVNSRQWGQAQFPGFVEADLELENERWRVAGARIYNAIDGAKRDELRSPLYSY